MSTTLALMGSMMPGLAGKSMVMLLIGAGMVFVPRGASSASKHILWTATLAAVLALPIAAIVLPTFGLPILPEPHVAHGSVRPVGSEPALSRMSVSRGGATGSVVSGPSRPGTSGPTVPLELEGEPPVLASTGGLGAMRQEAARHAWPLAAPSLMLAPFAALLWLIGVALLAGRLLIGAAGIRCRSRSSVESDDQRVIMHARMQAGRLGVTRDVSIRVGPSDCVPVTWGVFAPTVLLPSTARDWDAERIDAVLLHELGHIARFDALTQMIAQLAVTIFWFNPLTWFAARQARLERERACDDLVLASGVRASRYAEDLLAVVLSLELPGRSTFATLAMARPSDLEGRILAILDPRHNRGGVTRGGARYAAGLWIALVSVAAIQPRALSTSSGREGPGPVASISAIDHVTSTTTQWQSPVDRTRTVPGIDATDSSSRQVRVAGLSIRGPEGQSPTRTAVDSILVRGEATCRTCRITHSRIATLGSQAGVFSLGDGAVAVRDGRGRTFVSTSDLMRIAVFDASGQYLRIIGSEDSLDADFLGRGTGFHQIGPGDSLFVRETNQHVVAVFSPQLDFIRYSPIPIASIGALLPLADGRIVLDGQVGPPPRSPRTSDTILHVVAGAGGIVRSFGEIAAVQRCSTCTVRALSYAPGRPDELWAAELSSYHVQRWDTSGALLIDMWVEGSSWFGTPRPADAPPDSEDAPPRPRIACIFDDGQGRLWVIGQMASPDYRRVDISPFVLSGRVGGVRVIRAPTIGGVNLPDSLAEQLQDNVTTVVDVIDIAHGTLLASQRFDHETFGLAGNGVVFERRRAQDGSWYVDLFRLSLTGPGG